jgi:alanine racemase
MSPSIHVRVVVDLRRVRANAQEIKRATGVPLLAVIKADAYGLGAKQVAGAIAELVYSFCVFSADEAMKIDLWRQTGKPALAIGPPNSADPDIYLAHHIRPTVSNPADAATLKRARPVLCVDTGQQRFACPIDQVMEVVAAGQCIEAFTHARTLSQIDAFRQAVEEKVSILHAAGSSLLHDPAAWLNGVRPGLALCQSAMRVSARLVEARKGAGPAGYTGFVTPWHGVILAGYSNGLRPGPCLVNGRPSRILEVGMQSAFVETQPVDKVGDEVVLLGDSLSEQQIAQLWGTSPQECLVRLAGSGSREYIQE